MDLFEAGCQGLGLALASGMLGGAIAGIAADETRDARPATVLLLVLAAAAGAIVFGASLAQEDHPAWPGWIAGAAAAAFALIVTGSIVAGAARRGGEGGSAPGIAAMVALVALVLAGLALTPVAPSAIVVLLALVWLEVGRRRRAAQKYKGLRILRG